MSSQQHILIVDDEAFYVRLLVEVLSPLYQVTIATSGEQALTQIASGAHPDLILLDIMMSGMDGYTVCEQLKNSPQTHDIPIIFLTAKDEEADELHGFALGACDYITKPISAAIVKARISIHLALINSRKALEQQNSRLEEMVHERTAEISRTQDVAIYCLASIVETRDNETGKHIRRTQFYVKALAQHIRNHPRFQAFIDDDFIELLFKSAPLHDLGKIGVPDAILLKPGKLNDKEWEEMKRHTEYGKRSIDNAEGEYGQSSFLHMAKEIAYSHHEKWDGSGYPEHLCGDLIPVSARIMAIADCYDALISRRPYKKPFSHETASQIILEGRGTHFDPDITDAFEALQDTFADIGHTFADETSLDY
jgi:putative two-component system response regulator